MLCAPVAHGVKHGIERLAFRREGVFGLWRNNGIDYALDETIPFQLAELLGKHFVGCLGD